MKKLFLLFILLPFWAISQNQGYTGKYFRATQYVKSPLYFKDSDTLVSKLDSTTTARNGSFTKYNLSRLNTAYGKTSSQWTTTGSDIYYTTGNVGIGNKNPLQLLHVTGVGRFGEDNFVEIGCDMFGGDYGMADIDSTIIIAGHYDNHYVVCNPYSTNYGIWFKKSTNRFGINKKNPSYVLDINGNLNSTYYLLNGSSLKASIDTVSTSLTGILKATSGKLAIVTPSTDIDHNGLKNYIAGKHFFQKSIDTVKTSLTGLLKSTSGLLSVASAGTDYQAALTNPVTGTGTSGYVAKFNGTSTLTNSIIQDDGTYVAIGTTPGTYKFQVDGTIYSSSSISAASTMRTSGLTTISSSGTSITIYPQDKDNPYIRFGAGNDNASFTTEWARFIVGGNLGLGLTAPTSKLHLDGGNATASYLQFTTGTTTGQTATDGSIIGSNGSTDLIINNQENDSIKLYTNNTLAASLDASQNLTTTGTVITPASTTTKAGLRLPHGTAPDSPTNGDVWTTTDGYFTRINGTSYNLLTGNTYFKGDGTTQSVRIGGAAGLNETQGSVRKNTYVGFFSGSAGTTGSGNTAIGNGALYVNTGSNNTALGAGAGYSVTSGSGNIFIGSYAGYRTNKSNRFAVNNANLSTAANDSTKSMLWGMFNTSDITKQYLKVNGNLNATYFNYGTDAGSSDTYAATIPGIYTYATGMVIYFYANTANTGACTININSLGAKALKSLHDQDPADSYIEAGSMVHAIYDGTNFQMLQPDANP